MLINQEAFDTIEQILKENGTIASFEEKNGPIKGRMMITLTEPPKELDLDSVEEEGVYAFECSFDFYDSSIGILLNTVSAEVRSGLWVTPQCEGADAPDMTWIEFFVKTLMENISPDGSFGVPMYTFVTDDADFTVVPVMQEEV